MISPRVRAAAAMGALLLLTLAVYFPALFNGFIWDDDYYVHNNRTLGSVDGLKQIWFDLRATPQYYPLVFTTFWLEFRLWGLNPAGYHAVNILLHALVAALLWLLLARLEVPGAWMAAALFAVHPVHVETVAWVTEHKNLLSAAFYLSSALLYLRWASVPDSRPGLKAPARLYVGSLFLFLCALLSKTVACSLPVALLLVLWWKRGRMGRSEVRPLVPFFTLGAVFGALTAWIETFRVGALGEEWDHSIIERCLIAGRAVWFYASKLLWPERLTFVYPRWQIDDGIWWLYAFPLSVVAAVAALWVLRRRIGRAPLVAALFFIGTLTPALGFFNVYPMRFSYVADHFQYLASIGPLTLAASGLFLGYRSLGRSIRPIGLSALLLVFLALGALTLRQVPVYASNETLWRDTIAKNPDAWLAHNNLAGLLRPRGRVDEAIHHYREALRLKPDLAHAHSKLGAALRTKGEFEAAMHHLEEALRLEPDSVDAHNNMALTLKAVGRPDDAIRHYREALRIKPEAAVVHYNLGTILEARGRPDEAIKSYGRAVQLEPDFTAASSKLGLVLTSRGRLDEAITHLREALRLTPQDPQLTRNLNAALEAARQQRETGGAALPTQ